MKVPVLAGIRIRHTGSMIATMLINYQM
jgi:hypothetical protein